MILTVYARKTPPIPTGWSATRPKPSPTEDWYYRHWAVGCRYADLAPAHWSTLLTYSQPVRALWEERERWIE